jgi:hypothetical protein
LNEGSLRRLINKAVKLSLENSRPTSGLDLPEHSHKQRNLDDVGNCNPVDGNINYTTLFGNSTMIAIEIWYYYWIVFDDVRGVNH